MAEGDLVGARAFFDASVVQDRAFPSVWNNLGVLDNREGNTDAARQALDRALRLDGRQDAALTNASALYRQLGLDAQAKALERRLKSVQREDPFAQYMLGTQAEQAGSWPKPSAITGRPCACMTPRTSSTSGWRACIPVRAA